MKRGLAISDLLMATNFLSSALKNLVGPNIGTATEKTFCSFNGFMVQTFVDQSITALHIGHSGIITDHLVADYWVLTIAVCTYLFWDNHKAQSDWIQDHRIIVWILPWCLSLLWATLGLVLVGYGDIGAWCWFTSDRT